MSLNAGSGVVVLSSSTSAVLSHKRGCRPGSGIVAFHDDGRVRWSFSTGQDGAIYTAMQDASLIVATTEKVHTLHAKTGKALWVHTFAKQSAATKDSKVSKAVKKKAPEPKAKQEAQPKKEKKEEESGVHDEAKKDPAPLDIKVALVQSDMVRAAVGPKDIVYVASNPIGKDGKRSGRLAAFNHSSGSLLWHADTGYTIRGGPSIGALEPGGDTKDSVVITVEDTSVLSAKGASRVQHRGRILTYSADTGAVNKWTYESPTWTTSVHPRDPCSLNSFSSPTIGGDGTVYVGGGNGELYAIKDNNGDGVIEKNEVSKYSADHAFSSSPVSIGPGLLLATPCKGMLVWKTF